MSATNLPVGSFVRIAKPELQTLIDQLRAMGYRTIGPRLSQGAVIYDDVDSVEQLPRGWVDQQDGGFYRLQPQEDGAYFDYVVGPHSLKNFLFPPRETLLQLSREQDQWRLHAPAPPDPPLAVLGARACDLRALWVQDLVFVEVEFVDPAYQARRSNLFVAAVNCRRAAATCFCHSMKTGPAVVSGFDLALTEQDDHFVIETGSERGGEAVAACPWTPCTISEIEAARRAPRELERAMHQRAPRERQDLHKGPPLRSLDVTDLRELLLNNLEHPRWESVAQRCLACANCTMVCPTCFCSTVDEVTDLTGDQVRRERSWASCFTAEHSYMNSGTVRKSVRSRYRQWLTHKLATWIDQFGVSGCVGCGRCITWCPVGIDLTEEIAALRGTMP